MLDGEEFRGVMNRAVAVIVVANSAIKHVIAENPVKSFSLSSGRLWRNCGNTHSRLYLGGASPDQLPVHFHHAGVAGLNRAKLRVITDLRDFGPRAVEEIHQALLRLCFRNRTVDSYHQRAWLLKS